MAGEKAGIKLLIQIETAPGVFTLLGGLRSKSLSFNSESVDVTNHSSDEWSTRLDNSGIRAMSLSGSGVHNGDVETLGLAEDNAIANKLTRFRILDTDNNGRSYTAYFKIASFERAGEYNAEQTYSISLESSGEVTIA